MSAYAEYQSSMKDPDNLRAAIEALGYDAFQVSEQEISIQGKPGSDKYMYAAAVKQADGSYRLQGDEDWLTPKFVGELKQTYAELQTIAKAKLKGYVYQGREVVKTATGQTVKLRFLQR